jgi:hypothetical protein
MKSLRRIAATAAAALAMAGAAAIAAAPAMASAPFGTFESASGQFLALTGAAPGHIGSSGVLHCQTRAGTSVAPQTSFDLVPVTAGKFAIQWANHDGRALGQHMYVEAGSAFVGIIHVINDESTWHLAGGQVVNEDGLALDLTATGGAIAVPAGGGQQGAQLTQVSC